MSHSLLAGLVSLVLATPASAVVTLNFVETPSGVVGSFSGSLDLMGLSYVGSVPARSSAIAPGSGGGFIFISADLGDQYISSTIVPSAFGTGSLAVPSSVSGDTFAFFENAVPGWTARIYVPSGYVSGTALAGSASFSGETLASLGIGLGPYVTSLGNGDSITIIATPVPEPASMGLMAAGLGVLWATARRQRAKMPGAVT